jgi:hypothetical protein
MDRVGKMIRMWRRRLIHEQHEFAFNSSGRRRGSGERSLHES